MSELAAFLAQAVPWPTVQWPGYTSIHSPWLRPGSTKPLMPGHAFTELDPAVSNAEWRVRQGNDVYVCMSLQANAMSKPGKRNLTAKRDGPTTVGVMGFWLDVDLKDGFADEEDLLRQFGAWRRKVGLPIPSFVIFTGGGFHIHWVLVHVILPAQWHDVANALKEACQREGFKADDTCTTDITRIMRVPGSYNHKFDPPRLVQIVHSEGLVTLDQMAGPLAPYRTAYRRPVSPGATAPKLSLPPGSRPSKVFDGMVLGPSLGSGLDTGWKPTAVEVAAACPWFRDTLGMGGANDREPLWFEALKVAYHCKDGPAAAHAASDLHADYTRQDTDDKFEAASKSAAKFGWPQCQTIKSAGATQCAGCANLVHGKSPLNFALTNINPAPAQSRSGPGAAGPQPGPIPGTSQTGPVVPFMPYGYRYCPNGFIEHLTKAEDRKTLVWERMYPLRVNGFGRQEVNAETGFGKELFYFQYEDARRWRQVQLTLRDAQDTRAFKAILNTFGMTFKDHEASYMGRFIVSFVQQLRAAQHLSVECEPYGWAMKDGVEDAFTYDGTRFNCSGNKQIAPTDTGLGEKFKSTGSLDIWKDACKLITDQQRPDLNTLLACGFAAPLVQMTGHNGFVVSAYSAATGVQKSAALRVSQSMWGHPVSGMAGLDDTNNFLNTRLGMLRHLPLFVDELKFADEFRRAETMVLGITQGKTKGRLNRSSETMETLTFNTMMVTCSNASLVNHISEHSKTTTAGMARIFEFVVERGSGVGMIDTGKAQALIGQLEHNYGRAGRVYAEFLGQNVGLVRADVRNMIETINNIVKGTTDERFWVAAIAVLIVGAKYAEDLKLADIGVGKLSLFLLDQFKKQRRETEVSASNIGSSNTIERYVLEFINAHPQQTIKTDTVDTTPGRSVLKPVVLNDVNSIVGLSRGISIHAVRDLKLVRISVSDFGRWLAREHKVSKHEVLKKIKELLPAKEIKVSIGRGTVYKRAPEAVMEFDTNLMPAADLFT